MNLGKWARSNIIQFTQINFVRADLVNSVRFSSSIVRLCAMIFAQNIPSSIIKVIGGEGGMTSGLT
jgi:hypothetical protein